MVILVVIGAEGNIVILQNADSVCCVLSLHCQLSSAALCSEEPVDAGEHVLAPVESPLKLLLDEAGNVLRADEVVSLRAAADTPEALAEAHGPFLTHSNGRRALVTFSKFRCKSVESTW